VFATTAANNHYFHMHILMQGFVLELLSGGNGDSQSTPWLSHARLLQQSRLRHVCFRLVESRNWHLLQPIHPRRHGMGRKHPMRPRSLVRIGQHFVL